MPLLYDTPDAWLSAPEKRLSVFGMSGLGKTRLASLMRDQGEWFHYSIDYRIGTAYMGEHITDNLKRQAMRCRSWPTSCGRIRSISAPTSPSGTSRRFPPFWASPGIPRRAACPSRNTCAGRTCTAGRRSTRFWTRPASSPARAISMATPTWSATPAARSARWWTPPIPKIRCCKRFRPIRSWSDRRAPRRITRRSWSDVSTAPKPMYYRPIS
jgi:hypothetical protein